MEDAHIDMGHATSDGGSSLGDPHSIESETQSAGADEKPRATRKRRKKAEAADAVATVPAAESMAGGVAEATADAGSGDAGGAESTEADGAKPRLVEEPVAAEQVADVVFEALLFASDAPVSLRRLADLSGCGAARLAEEAIARLNEKYEGMGCAFRIEKLAGGYQMLTTAAFHEVVSRLEKQRAQNRLGDAALETLAIIAYRQPIIRADIEAIRGVACGEVLTRLREAGLIRIAGRAEVVGRPLLYATTRKFLDIFGLGGLEDLPASDGLSLPPRSAGALGDGEGPPRAQSA
ncbi:MAG: SMC-Scp complex subunit ScpB [Phycisphaerae bacterium]|nr:SMC-Scp complex subunit ScpB [Phycisphaerae bacterium]